jgi:hypothetical protein
MLEGRTNVNAAREEFLSQRKKLLIMLLMLGYRAACIRADTTFSDFNRDHGAAIRMLATAQATLVDVAFKRTEVSLPPPDSEYVGIAGSAITAINNSRIWLEVSCTPDSTSAQPLPEEFCDMHQAFDLCRH